MRSKTMRQARKSCALDWIERSKQYASGKHMLNDEYLKFSLDECLSSMTEKQLKLLNVLAAASYSKGSDDNRNFKYTTLGRTKSKAQLKLIVSA